MDEITVKDKGTGSWDYNEVVSFALPWDSYHEVVWISQVSGIYMFTQLSIASQIVWLIDKNYVNEG